MVIPKGKVRSPHLSLRLHRPLHDELVRRAQIQERTKTDIVEEALKALFEAAPEDENPRLILAELRDRVNRLQNGQMNLLSRVKQLEED